LTISSDIVTYLHKVS